MVPGACAANVVSDHGGGSRLVSNWRRGSAQNSVRLSWRLTASGAQPSPVDGVSRQRAWRAAGGAPCERRCGPGPALAVEPFEADPAAAAAGFTVRVAVHADREGQDSAAAAEADEEEARALMSRFSFIGGVIR